MLGVSVKDSVYMFVIIVHEMPALLRYISNVKATSEGR